jgi:hypothetical protein
MPRAGSFRSCSPRSCGGTIAGLAGGVVTKRIAAWTIRSSYAMNDGSIEQER